MRFLIGSCIVFALTGVLCAQTRDDLLSTKVDEIVTQLRQQQRIPGTSLAVVRNGKIIKVASYGLANVELNVPVKPETIFPAASLTKQFTATAVMLLVEECNRSRHGIDSNRSNSKETIAAYPRIGPSIRKACERCPRTARSLETQSGREGIHRHRKV